MLLLLKDSSVRSIWTISQTQIISTLKQEEEEEEEEEGGGGRGGGGRGGGGGGEDEKEEEEEEEVFLANDEFIDIYLTMAVFRSAGYSQQQLLCC